MRTPAGKDCSFYYEDYFRGKQQRECRLIERNPDGGKWHPNLCKTCPVPGIQLANGCPHLVLEGKVASSFFGLRERVKVFAACTKTAREVKEPHIGCGECHEALKFEV